tara:strand:+ start:2784 stop:4106 length:1323 start_codon:yes stop_codon:yes gene_type:complete
MKETFFYICDAVIKQLNLDEDLIISFSGENSQYIRFNNAKIRQTGCIDDANIYLNFIKNNRSCKTSISFQGKQSIDLNNVLDQVQIMRDEINQLPEDPFIVKPGNYESIVEINKGMLIDKNNVVDKILPLIQGVDFTGIWASGPIYRGSANSNGQKNWFETESFSLDYSLITKNEKMVKGTFAGSEWDQENFIKHFEEKKQQSFIMNKTSKNISPGTYRTCLAPAAVADLISMFSWGGISEASIQQGSSALCKMRNDDISLSSKLNLSEDFRTGLVPRFNSSGEITADHIELFANGKLKNTLISTRTANEYKCNSNFAEEGEYLRTPKLSPGDLKESEILSHLDTGLYLSNLHYLNWSDRIGGRITGMTRYACFWVEKGQIVSPIDNMRFDDSIYNFFGDQLDGITDSIDFIPEVGTYGGRQPGGIMAPSVLIDGFNLTL